MITALFLAFVFYGVYQFNMALNAWISGDHIFEDKQRLMSIAKMVLIPIGIAVVLLLVFKSKIKFK